MASEQAATPPASPPPQPDGTTDRPTVDEIPVYAVADRPPLLQNKFVQDLLPLLSSLALHVGLALLIWLTYTAVQKVVEVAKEQIIIPDAQIVDGATPGGLTNPGLGEDPNQDTAQDQYADVPANSDGWSNKPSDTLSSNLMEGGSGENTDSMIGLGQGGSLSRGAGAGTGDGGSGGATAPFGMPGGGQGAGPRSQFMGVGGNATKIAYVCDASGSMLHRFDSLRIKIREAVDGLKAIQAFSIIFFREDSAESFDKQLIMATPENKGRAYEFLDITRPHGTTDPIPALKLAFDQKPQLIYLLTDGDFPDNQKVMDYIRQRNPAGEVKINTIAFMNRGEEYEKVLKQIAKENKGTFRFVSEDDLRN